MIGFLFFSLFQFQQEKKKNNLGTWKIVRLIFFSLTSPIIESSKSKSSQFNSSSPSHSHTQSKRRSFRVGLNFIQDFSAPEQLNFIFNSKKTTHPVISN